MVWSFRYATIGTASVVLILSLMGCDGGRKPDADPVSAGTVSQVSPGNSVTQDKGTQTGRAPVTLNGRNFINSTFTTESLVAPTTLALKNYGGVKAPVTLPREVKTVRVKLGTLENAASKPIPSVRITATSGKYLSILPVSEKVVERAEQEFTFPTVLRPGDYSVEVMSHKATNPDIRPQLWIHSIVFE